MENLKEGFYYHIYNRGAGRSQIFWDHIDYQRFLEKYWHYMHTAVETVAYCLLRNHFHFLIRVREIEEQNEQFRSLKMAYPTGSFFGDQFPTCKPFHSSTQLRHLFNSHTRYINAKLDRSGTLVEGTFKRKQLQDDQHLINLVCYIHRNPIHHGICKTYSDYPYSSYKLYLSNTHKFLEKQIVRESFDTKRNYIKAHDEFKHNLGQDFYLE